MSAISTIIRDADAWIDRERTGERLLDDLQRSGCVIYGAGGYGRDVAQALQERDVTVHFFIDGNALPEQEVEGIPVLRREDVPVRECAAVIAINNFQVDIREIADWSVDRFSDVLFVPEFPDIISPKLGNYWQAPRRIISENSGSLEALWSSLSDAKSRQVLEELVTYRTRAAPRFHPDVDRQNQYFSSDLPLAEKELSVVDCGAFPGDMLAAAKNAGHSVKEWYAFEPDLDNFSRLAAIARGEPQISASLFPCGVGDETGLFSFSGGAADASRASAEGEAGTPVPIVRVDDVLVSERIDMVKLDIEGFEAQAFDGMADLLRRHRPRLCVAIYHKPADLWQLPAKVKSMFPDARLAIRQHGYNGYDTVLYADL